MNLKRFLKMIFILALMTSCSPQTPIDSTTTPISTQTPEAVKDDVRLLIDSDEDGLSDKKESLIGTDLKNPDSDNDGITDYDEVTKYFTDPLKNDSDGDGFPDGEINERREFSSYLHAKMKIIKPFDVDSMNDHFQEINVVKEDNTGLLFDLYFFPNSYHIIEELPYPLPPQIIDGYQEYLKPDQLMNFDDEMKNLVKQQILISNNDFTDLEVIRCMYAWEINKVKMMPGTKDYFKPYPEPFLDIKIDDHGKILFPKTPIMFSKIDPRNSEYYDKELSDADWQMNHLILGKEMFINKTHGSCGSTANFHSTILRSLGIPTRIIQTIPIAFTQDRNQMRLLDDLSSSTKSRLLNQMGYNHFLVEALVGNRWIRINNFSYENHVDMSGAFIKIFAFDSWKDVSFALTWGYNRPYQLLFVEEIASKYPPITQNFK